MCSSDLNGGRFKSDYLDLYGLTVTNKSTGLTTFKVSTSGEITINGKVTMGYGSTIDWATVGNVNIEDNPAYTLADSAWDKAADAQWDIDHLDIPVLPEYIKSTYIGPTEIESPTITGNEIIARQYFTVAPNRYSIYGYMGMAYGMDAAGRRTYGVALSYDSPDSLGSDGCYVIVTNGGVRLQAPGHSLTVTSTGVWVDGTNISA